MAARIAGRRAVRPLGRWTISTPDLACPSCHAAVAAGSAFCTRCGGALTSVRVIAPVLDESQQWGGGRRRDRRDRGAGGAVAGRPSGPSGAQPPAGAVAVHPGAVGPPSGVAAGSGAAAEGGWGAVPASGSAAVVPAHDAALGPAFDGVVPALVGQRVGAYALDLLAVLAVAGPVLWLTRSLVYAGLAAAELAVGLVVWEARSGQTVGNAVLGLRTAKEETPYAPGLGRAVGRALVLAASHLVLGLGQWLVVASAGFDPSGRRQAWHDRVGGTVVVDVRGIRAALDPRVAPEAFGSPTVRIVAPSASAPVPAPVAPAVAVPIAPSWPAPAAPAAPAAGVAPSGPPSAVRAPAAAAPMLPVPVQPAAPATSYLLILDTGQRTTVSGPGLIGRRPQVPDGELCDRVIEVDDPGRSLSRTHAGFGIDARGFWVEDRGSANGTFVHGPDGTWTKVAPRERTTIPADGTVRLGERTFTVQPVR